jgi:hypothetical protein
MLHFNTFEVLFKAKYGSGLTPAYQRYQRRNIMSKAAGSWGDEEDAV